MNTFSRPTVRAVALLGMGALFLALNRPPAAAQDEQPLTAKVLRVTGGARYSTDGRTWAKLKTGALLRPGCVVQTSKHDSSVDLLLGEPPAGVGKKATEVGRVDPKGEPLANIIRLFDDTAVEIKALAIPGEDALVAELNLRSGRILGTVRRLASKSRYEVTFLKGAIGAGGALEEPRGTVYVVTATGSLAVLLGQLVMVSVEKDVSTEVVSADQRCDSATGKPAPLAADAPERELWRPKPE